ncbi:MAG: folate-binding protein YgfZ [Methylococcales bacterium]|nr:folate-binding protein YgfZ [Methylococcales bacterium]
MNPTWQDFLHQHPAVLLKIATQTLYQIDQLAILRVTGSDATVFLQGQLSCDVKKLSPQNSFFTAFCNAKGQVISTLLILKKDDHFLILLPQALLEKVQKKLQMYIMRSKVHLKNVSAELCLLGVSEVDLAQDNFSRQGDFIKLPQSRYLMISSVEKVIDFCFEKLNEGFLFQTSKRWHYFDLQAGLAWLTPDSSERYIPQMLNVEKFGGISFDKGCYTGQEVIARTHYLGKAKRELITTDAETIADKGTVLHSVTFDKKTLFLVVMPIQS